MSDSEEYEYEYDSDEQVDSDDQSLAVDGEDSEVTQQRNAIREAQIALENSFYEAEDFRQRGDLTQAFELYLRVVVLEGKTTPIEGRKWTFQALEHVVKICVIRCQWEDMLNYYEQMLEHLAFVTRNESTESISSILDVVSNTTGKQFEKDSAKYTSKMYELTLDKLKDVNNDRLWFSMNIKLGKLYLDMQEFDQLQRLFDQLYDYCQAPDHSKATSLLEVYALEIQLCVATKNSVKMRVIYPKTLDLDGAVADPRIMGIIREEGGKMYMEMEEWMLAYNEFFESFRNYQEAGNSRATQCLKYVVLANMLASSNINPFDSREAKVYQDVEEIGAMLLLRGAYETNDIVQFEKVLKNPKFKLLGDPIMKRYLNPLLRNIRCQVMKKIARPYQTIRIESLAKSLNISTKDVEEIAVALIQNLELDGKIDQSQGLLVLQTRQKTRDASKMYDALDRWSQALASTHAIIAARVKAHV
ncbi:COP9 signalosome, subunit CSN2 [Plasmopara halstedii]|uniref:COP9 signalosome, subunit CSN2 n=1 Tax=Plasmopara halstedii TaxID=4781 RepID=A0A0P1B763_PLAHL|nr:COP9 signalosome, subunit CSN2 [Plasmopara halstedii]CEG49528.1 COP9 signalosome, subunit CSN2 [Plasmopara halstedii]|eukprot:XP_024585897.1 COP9 signalosome, subunit CSN2 [Plasmopara halstedii]